MFTIYTDALFIPEAKVELVMLYLLLLLVYLLLLMPLTVFRLSGVRPGY